MARTLAQLRGDVRSRLNEATAAFWTNDELTRWINEGAADVARRTESLRDTFDIPIVIGTQTYTGPTDLVRAHTLEYRPTGDTTVHALTYRDKMSADALWGTGQANTDGTPLIWTSWGFPPTIDITVYPTPNAAGSLRLHYYRLPATVALDGDVVEIPSGWEDLISEYATQLALRKDGNPRWQEAFSAYTAHLEALMETAIRFNDQAGQIDDIYGGALAPTWLYAGNGDW